jgi:hypothetical protein
MVYVLRQFEVALVGDLDGAGEHLRQLIAEDAPHLAIRIPVPAFGIVWITLELSVTRLPAD